LSSEVTVVPKAVDKFGFQEIFTQDGKTVIVEDGVQHFVTTIQPTAFIDSDTTLWTKPRETGKTCLMFIS